MTKYPIGEVTTATENQELVPDLLYELTRLSKGKRVESAKVHRELIRDVKKRINHKYADGEVRDYYDDGDVEQDIEALATALDEYSAPYFHFSDYNGLYRVYGYWLDREAIEDFDGLKVSDTSDIPADYRGEVLYVNDHGNTTLYVKSARKLTEIWSVV